MIRGPRYVLENTLLYRFAQNANTLYGMRYELILLAFCSLHIGICIGALGFERGAFDNLCQRPIRPRHYSGVVSPMTQGSKRSKRSSAQSSAIQVLRWMLSEYSVNAQTEASSHTSGGRVSPSTPLFYVK